MSILHLICCAINPDYRLFHFCLSSAIGSPRNLRVFDETINTMRLTWDAAPGNVRQYVIAFKPAEAGERREVTVRGDTTQALLENLQPETEYELFVSARYTSGLGDPLLGTGTTLEGKKECLLISVNLSLEKWYHQWCSMGEKNMAQVKYLHVSFPKV